MKRTSILICASTILFMLSTGCKSCSPPPEQGRLFGITACCPNEFTEIDPVAGTLDNQLNVGDMGYGFPVGARAVDSSSDIFYVVRHNAGVPHVLSIETNSATFLESPPLGRSLLTLGYDSNAGHLVGVTSCCPNDFVNVDAGSGMLVPLASIGDMGFAFVAGASAMDSATNRFFMIRHNAGTPHLIAVDTNSGAVTETPALSTGIMKLGFDEDDNVLVAVTSCCPNQFGHLDTTTGAFTAISEVGDMGYGFSAGASAVDSSGNRLFLARSQAGVPHIVSVDTLTGAVVESPALSENLLSLRFNGP